jgi:RNA polymerase sigma-70 factor (ECF subfamily)
VQSAIANLLPALNQAPTVAEVSANRPTPGIAAMTAAIRAGNEEAFREFHRLYFDRLYQFLLIVTRGNEHEARDALQETLLRVIRYARKFDDEEIFWSWLKTVARSATRDAGRKQNRYLNLLQKFAFHSETHVRNQTSNDSLVDLLEDGLDSLTTADRQLIESKYLHGASVKELAANTGMTEKAVESLLLRLRHRIREFILKKLRAQ